MFFDLAQSWSRLAELDDTNTFLRALHKMEFEDVLVETVSDEASLNEAA